MNRHPENNNLLIHHDPHYRGLPIQVQKAPFITQYLDRLYMTMSRALDEYSRVLAFRVDLRFPASMDQVDLANANQILNRFFESFRAQIKYNRHVASQSNERVHGSSVRYVWARESGQLGRPHYHLVIFLNCDAYCSLGKYELGRDNLFNRLHKAWGSALGLPVEAVAGLVELPKNAAYVLRRDCFEGRANFYYRTSYLCKVATKQYGSWQHAFGCSRI
ncbi:inovirus Gp2 family protein [Pseudomonas aeruginosa]|uniref:inovirus Gp2 family protein n=1 Tax=Pseudomonas aeruginosa TaxID=287 RepID=UPI001A23255C|nr:inovirus Gp2 family protein [Pseudomonas aeruginosa]MBI7354293.1 inovirus Gp2 family protein [Pseudomonas aeruginosa]MBI8948684.1 inovirus Gp2 family protein [Pseudomonas aeruginosa]MDU0538065.1 inovirus Gp2 family protein [Pseudomonas aeruginosa]HEJ4043538.1 inovirus Gp2 family protein [Pseudomonas aeruginosa]HEJ5767215.1 inovirus Gp2 family protein [Pseudomonas aeruginosa]